MVKLAIVVQHGSFTLDPQPTTLRELTRAAEILGCVLGRLGTQIQAAAHQVPEDDSLVVRLADCEEHGPSGRCWVQDDGSHISNRQCTCGPTPGYSPDCVVDFHRRIARNEAPLTPKTPNLDPHGTTYDPDD